MITSKKLSDERLREIKKIPIVYTEDCSKLSADQIARMKPAHPEYRKVESVRAKAIRPE
jgi:hypothetical protein